MQKNSKTETKIKTYYNYHYLYYLVFMVKYNFVCNTCISDLLQNSKTHFQSSVYSVKMMIDEGSIGLTCRLVTK
jgi:hypothetical protein